MTNGMIEPAGLPTQNDEKWWQKAIGGLQEDPSQWASILGRGAQAFSARDPQSWQHQLGGTAAQIGQAQKMGMTAEADKKRRDEFRNMLLKAMGLDVPTPGEEAVAPPSEPSSGLGGLGGMNDQDLMQMFLGR